MANPESIDFDKLDTSEIVHKTTDDKNVSDFLRGYTENMKIKQNQETLREVEKEEEQATEQPHERTPPKETITVGGELITGAMFVALIDTLAPLMITFLNDKFSKTKLNKDDLKRMKLNAQQRKELTPVCDEVVKYLDITENPIVILVISLIGIYGVNYMVILQEKRLEEQIRKEKEAEKEKDK